MVTKGKNGGRDSQGVWDGHGHTAVFHMENHKDLLNSTENSALCHVAAWMGAEFEGKWKCMAESLLCSSESVTTLFTSYTPIPNAC